MTTSTESQGWAGEEEETQGNPKRLQKKTPLGPQGERHGGMEEAPYQEEKQRVENSTAPWARSLILF